MRLEHVRPGRTSGVDVRLVEDHPLSRFALRRTIDRSEGVARVEPSVGLNRVAGCCGECAGDRRPRALGDVEVGRARPEFGGHVRPPIRFHSRRAVVRPAEAV